MASINPFAKSGAASGPGAGVQASLSDSIASNTNGATNQVRSLGATAKSAVTKTKNAVTGVFAPAEATEEVAVSDPLSLANMPKNIGPEVYVAQGQLWESSGDYNKAMESYARALENEANNAPALTSIARLHFRQGNHKQAAEFFRRAINQNPNDAGLYNDLGLTLSKLGDHAGASQSLQKSLEIAPGTSRYANNLAAVNFQAGQPEAAYLVLAQHNKPAVAHFNMAYLHFKNGQMLEARNHLGQAMQSQPQAAGDASVQRAIDRSRDLLAKIDATMAPIAQAAPQAAIAGSQLFQQGAAIKQTSQSTSTAMPSTTATSVPSLNGVGVPTKPVESVTAPKVSAPTTTSTRSLPIKPTENGPAPSVPFAMPGTFTDVTSFAS